MAKGNAHKIHDGYRRSQERTSTQQLLTFARNEMADEQRELMFSEMDLDFGVSDFSYGDYYGDAKPECDFDFDDYPHDYSFF